MATRLSHKAEEYIEAIYKIQKRSGVAKTKELAKELNVVVGSVTNTIEHLEKHGLVEHKPYKGVKLTKKGEKLALDILRRHRLAERLLTDLLKADWSEVHENACKLEHALTKETAALIEKRLGYPKLCPHGNPIPTEKGYVKEEKGIIPITEANLNKTYIVAKITNEKRETLKTLASKGIKPNTPLHLVRKGKNRIILCVAGKEQTLDHAKAAHVWVKQLKVKNHAIQK